MVHDSVEFVRALTPVSAVLLIFVLALRLWLRDRNARIADLKEENGYLREALRISEEARAKDRETTQLALESSKDQELFYRALRELASGRAKEDS